VVGKATGSALRLSRFGGRVGVVSDDTSERIVTVRTTLACGAQCVGSAAASRNMNGVLSCMVVVVYI